MRRQTCRVLASKCSAGTRDWLAPSLSNNESGSIFRWRSNNDAAFGIHPFESTLRANNVARQTPPSAPPNIICCTVYTQTLAFSYSLFYLQNRINNYKQTTTSTVCVNYDYVTIRNTAAVQFCGNKSAKFPGKLRHITEQIYDFTQP